MKSETGRGHCRAQAVCARLDARGSRKVNCVSGLGCKNNHGYVTADPPITVITVVFESSQSLFHFDKHMRCCRTSTVRSRFYRYRLIRARSALRQARFFESVPAKSCQIKTGPHYTKSGPVFDLAGIWQARFGKALLAERALRSFGNWGSN